MSWLPGFLAPVAAWLALLSIPLVILYFLKLKRPRQEVSSLVLWRQVLNDNRVNSPFQKFKKNLLLLLQLLALLLLILAAMQPFMRGNVGEANRVPILIDHSASMRAMVDGQTRLDAAKKIVNDMIDGLGDGRQLSIISFSNSARKLCDFTDNPRLLRDALAAIAVDDVPSHIEDAMRITEALAKSQPFEKAILISDGNFPAESDFALPFAIDYELLPTAGPNFGITAFNARRASKGNWNVFALIEGSDVPDGHAAAAVTGKLELLQDGKPVNEGVAFVLSQGQSQRMEFSVAAEKATSLELRMTINGPDSLRTDNRAYLDLEAARRLWVFVPPYMTPYRDVYRDNPDVRLMPEADEAPDLTRNYDLVISDRKEHMSMIAPTRFFVGFIPDDVGGLLKVDDNETTKVIDWSREDSALRFVQLSEVIIGQNIARVEDVGSADFDRAGYQVIADGEAGPLILKHRAGDILTYHMLFDPFRSTLVYRIGFPIMAMNIVELAMHQSHLAEAPGLTTGVLPPLRLLPEKTYTAKGPDGPTRDYTSDIGGRLAGISAPVVGRYEISEAGLITGDVVAQVGASLLNRGESALGAITEISFNEQKVAADESEIRADRAHWRTLLWVSLAVLAIEWWYFNRKIGGFAR